MSQCPTCGYARSILSASCPNCKPQRRIGTRGPVPGGYTRNFGQALAAFDDLHARDMEAGARSLLRALYRAHPYVFDAAERQGRLAVRP